MFMIVELEMWKKQWSNYSSTLLKVIATLFRKIIIIWRFEDVNITYRKTMSLACLLTNLPIA